MRPPRRQSQAPPRPHLPRPPALLGRPLPRLRHGIPPRVPARRFREHRPRLPVPAAVLAGLLLLGPRGEAESGWRSEWGGDRADCKGFGEARVDGGFCARGAREDVSRCGGVGDAEGDGGGAG